ncbi:MAG: hypothetical protein MRY21_00795 [Simkaniaceae bacterium]|nr:hypothetical protein [Simkaniaceae bacterium]
MKFFLILFLPLALFAEKVLIYTYAYNRPEFIEMQHKTLKHFVEDDFEFVVFNDAVNTKMRREIEAVCHKEGVKCVRIPQPIHAMPYLHRLAREDINAPSVRNCNVVQFSLNRLGFNHNGIVVLLDSDLFLVKPINFHEYLAEHPIASVMQYRTSPSGERVDYLWIGLAMLDFSRLPNHRSINFNCGTIKEVNVDSGGHTHDYLASHRDIAVNNLNLLYVSQTPQNSSFTEEENALIAAQPKDSEWMADRHFLHYRAGSNWNLKSPGFHREKYLAIKNFIERITQ